MPVYWKGQFVGVIGIEIDYEMLKQEVQHISVFKSGYAFILDENSNVFYHPLQDSAQLNLETTAIDEPEQFIGSNHIQYNYEGVQKEAVWIPLSNGMRLYVCAPVSEINSGWTGMIKNILIALLVILAISIVAMMRFTGRITKPLAELTEAAKQLFPLFSLSNERWSGRTEKAEGVSNVAPGAIVKSSSVPISVAFPGGMIIGIWRKGQRKKPARCADRPSQLARRENTAATAAISKRSMPRLL